MNLLKRLIVLFQFLLLLFITGSCNTEFKATNYTAYFGGEVSNPKARYVLFCKDADVLDTLHLNENNRFFKKFDSLAPGMYTFRHEPEYQYVYFDKNDSLLVFVNSRDFDESVVFTGRGEEKNNLLMELYLNNERDMAELFNIFDYDVNKFLRTVNSAFTKNRSVYTTRKTEIQWSDEFDVFAQAVVNFPYYSKKEIYPVIHQLRNGVDVTDQLPKDYYDFRKDINFDDPRLSHFSPFVRYLSHMLNNVSAQANQLKNASQAQKALETNTLKLNIADTLINNEATKNMILNNIAFTYLLEDQNMANNQKFLEVYQRYSTDKSKENEITNISNAIRQLVSGGKLPAVDLVDSDGREFSSDSLMTKKTVIFFWTSEALPHMAEAHVRVKEYRQKNPEYQFIAVNLDTDHQKWLRTLDAYKIDDIPQFRVADFESMKYTWAITKIHRTIVLDEDGIIKTAFTNLFDQKFEEHLK